MKQPQTSQQWWDTVKTDPTKIVEWLKAQYRGEAAASTRVRDFAEKYAKTDQEKRVLDVIAGQEFMHAIWVADLLRARNETYSSFDSPERYWAHTLPDIESWETGCAVAAQAEAMRLERIKVIVNDPETPEDIRTVFAKILPEELFHERAFREYTTPDALAKTDVNRVKGLEALGLVL